MVVVGREGLATSLSALPLSPRCPEEQPGGTGAGAALHARPAHLASARHPDTTTLPQVSNQAALGLVQRFMHNKREFDGTATRDRFKLIPRIVNADEWAEKGPLSGKSGWVWRSG